MPRGVLHDPHYRLLLLLNNESESTHYSYGQTPVYAGIGSVLPQDLRPQQTGKEPRLSLCPRQPPRKV